MSQPNVLFVFTDDQRFDTIAALGNSEIDTPNLDRLVAEGTTFTHAHIMGGTSGAVCMPSRAMMLSGRTLFHIEKQGQRIPAEHVTFPERFRQSGYVTTHIGKWHQDREAHCRCFSTGAKIFGFKKKHGWYEACNGHWHIPVHDFDPQGVYDSDGGYNEPAIEPYQLPYETTKDRGKHSCEVFTDEAVDFIRSRDGSPYLMYLAHIAPHDPRQYPERLAERYTAERVSLPPNFAIMHAFDNGDMLIRDEVLEAHPRRPGPVRQHIADYYGIITHVDEQIGRILDALDETGQRENTIVVFAGDNGLAVGQHGLMGKQNLYEHSARVPLIMSGPGIPANQRSDTLCYLLDIYPTLCELTGVEAPETVEGKSLVPAIKEPTTHIRDVVHLAYKGYQRGVRDYRHKLIEYAVGGERHTQLFDIQADPREMNSLADDPSMAATLEGLRHRLREWQTDLGDTQEMGIEFWQTYDGGDR